MSIHEKLDPTVGAVLRAAVTGLAPDTDSQTAAIAMMRALRTAELRLLRKRFEGEAEVLAAIDAEIAKRES